MSDFSRQAELLATAGNWIVHARAGDAVLRVLVETAARLLDAPTRAGLVSPGEGVHFSVRALPDGQVELIDDHAPLGAEPIWSAVEACELHVSPVAGERLCLTSPLLAADGDVLGIVQTECSAADAPEASTLRMLDALVAMAALGLSRLRMECECVRLDASEAARLAAEARYRSLYERLDQGVVYQDADGRIIDANPAAERILGVSHDCLMGLTSESPDWRAIREDGSPLLGTEHPAMVALRTGEPVRDALMGIWHGAEGAYHWILVSAIPEFRPGESRPWRVFATFTDVTVRQEAQAALAASEERFRSIFEGMSEGVALHDLVLEAEGRPVNYRLIEVNPRYEAITGLRREDVIGRLATEVYGTDEPPYLAEFTGPAMSFETYFPPMRTWFIISVAPIDETRFATIFFDVTRLHEAEAEVGDYRDRLNAVLTTVPTPVFAKDRACRYTLVNPAFEEFFGRPASEIIGQPITEAMHGQATAYVRERDAELLARGGTQVYEHQFVRHDGLVRDVLVHKAAITDDSGAITGLVGTLTDVSDFRQLEDALQRERAFLTTAIDILPFPIFVRTPDEQVFLRNHALRELMRQSMGEATSGQVGFTLLDAHSRAPIPREEWPEARALRGEVVANFECVVRLPDGREYPTIGQAAPVRVDGKLEAVIVASQDISALKAADRAKDEFLAILSHELKTPLTAIIGWTQAALEAPDLREEALKVIDRSAQHQRRLIEDLIDISRVLHGKLALRLGPTELWRIADEAAEALAQLARERRLTLVRCPPDARLPIHGDPARLRQVVTNLLDNAVRHTPADGTVTLAAWREGDRLVLTVSDTGEGMTPEELGMLFTPFRQVRPLTSGVGLGLGLALVRAIVEAHGGTVSADSPGPGQGSTFTVVLPCSEGEA